jgi:heme-degrading monooxygenase HmoA
MGPSEDRVSVVSTLALRARPGMSGDLIRAFGELKVFDHSHESGGFLGGRLLASLGGEDEVLVLAEWESAGAYRTWLENPIRAELAERIDPLLRDHVVAGSLYEEVQ